MRSAMLNGVINNFEKLPLNDKEYVADIIEKQLIEAKRCAIARRAKKAQSNLKKGEVKRGTTKDLYMCLERAQAYR